MREDLEEFAGKSIDSRFAGRISHRKMKTKYI